MKGTGKRINVQHILYLSGNNLPLVITMHKSLTALCHKFHAVFLVEHWIFIVTGDKSYHTLLLNQRYVTMLF